MVLERAQWVVEDEVVKGIEVPILRRNGDGPGEAGRDRGIEEGGDEV